MRTSISTTSGRARGTSSTASCPSAASPTTVKPGLGLEDHPQALAHHRLVVDEGDARHEASVAASSSGAPRLFAVGTSRRPGTGSSRPTRQPPPRRGPAWNVPPAAAARSCIPTRP